MHQHFWTYQTPQNYIGYYMTSQCFLFLMELYILPMMTGQNLGKEEISEQKSHIQNRIIKLSHQVDIFG